MDSIESNPTLNALPMDIKKWPTHRQWEFYSNLIGRMIDRYIIVRDYIEASDHSGQTIHFPLEQTSAYTENPHSKRIEIEHSYCSTQGSDPTRPSRRIPQWLRPPIPRVSQAVQIAHSYACAVLCDGLLLLELRDAIHQGDGPRILRCWKFMLLYFKRHNHHKYALEAFRLLAALNGVVSPLVREQIIWSRTINTRGGPGNNIPVDLYNEHLNRTLKDYIKCLGANVTEKRIVDLSKSLQSLHSLCHNADRALEIAPESLHHTVCSSEKDEKLIIDELVVKSRVFEYIPGRSHHSPINAQPCIAKDIDSNKLLMWITNQKKKLKIDFEFQKYLEL